jgi:hypothetical protein
MASLAAVTCACWSRMAASRPATSASFRASWSSYRLLVASISGAAQELADETFAALLQKHGRPVDLKTALRSTHFIAELTLTPKCSAASRRDAPVSTASITRSRRSPEYDFGIAHPRIGESMHKDWLILNPLGIPPIQIRREPL